LDPERPRQYRWSLPIVATILCVVATLVVLELASRLLFTDSNADRLRLTDEIRQRLNTPEENRTDLPLYLPRQGGECVKQDETRLHWHPRFGYNSKTLDKECARRLFASAKLKVLMFGGSTMANVGTINYLTSLDYYAFGDNGDIASINLAEPGTRLWNGVARFIEEGIELQPDFAIFLDGNNEFSSIRYGGKPGDDAHWTVGVRGRIERPLWALLDQGINQSRFAQAALIGTGIFPSARRVLSQFDLNLVDKDVQQYVHARDVAEVVCSAHRVRCLFILQPNAMQVENPSGSTLEIVKQQLAFFPFDREIYSRGYQGIRDAAKTESHLDASHLLDGMPDGYVDWVHLSKAGNASLAEFIKRQIELRRETTE
jgi:hypothetical protein